MNGWRFTKVWQVDHKLVVADTINEAVELFKTYMGKDYSDEPYEIKRIGTHTAICDREALIEEDRLFIVTPEPEMSEMEISLLSWLSDDTSGEIPMERMKQVVKARAAELLATAKQQLLQSGELLTQEHHEKLMETQYKETLEGVKKNWHDYFTPQAVTDIYNAGRNDVLKDLPRWRIWRNGACGNSEGHAIALVAGAGGIRFVNVLGATGEKYIMLDDLKKLPGFNDEDYDGLETLYWPEMDGWDEIPENK